MTNPATIAVIEALADVDTAYRCADDAGTVHAVGRLLGALDHAARTGEDLTLTAAQIAAATRRED
jgi:hypothetical protein